MDRDSRAEPVSVRLGTYQLHLEEIHVFFLIRQVADKHHRFGVKVVGDDVKVPIVVQIENDGGPRSQRSPDINDTRPIFDNLLQQRFRFACHFILGCVELKTECCYATIASGLDPQDELAVQKVLALVIQKDGINTIAVRIIHAGRDEHVDKSIGIEIPHAQSPGPIVLCPDLVGNLVEAAGFGPSIKGISVNAVVLAEEKRLRPYHFRLFFFLVRRD